MATDVTGSSQILSVPIIALVKEACLPFQDRGKQIIFSLNNLEHRGKKIKEDQIVIRRSSEIIHGLRNIIQNATDFSKKDVLSKSVNDLLPDINKLNLFLKGISILPPALSKFAET